MKVYLLNIIEKVKKDYKKKLVKDIKIFLKKKKKKSNNMVVNVTKISQKMKKINWLSIEKKCCRTRKNALLQLWESILI